MDLKLEIVVLPVSDVARSKEFYAGLGFREDADFAGSDGYHIVQMTPPGSLASIIFGTGVSDARPGVATGIHFVVDDIMAAHDELAGKGVKVSEVWHDAGGVFHHNGTTARVPGPQPERASYSSFLSFEDPDGNTFTLQEITSRLPGRITDVVYHSVGDLEQALRDAEAAHGKHEQETGQPDENWPAWYAQYMAKATGVA